MIGSQRLATLISTPFANRLLPRLCALLFLSRFFASVAVQSTVQAMRLQLEIPRFLGDKEAGKDVKRFLEATGEAKARVRCVSMLPESSELVCLRKTGGANLLCSPALLLLDCLITTACLFSALSLLAHFPHSCAYVRVCACSCACRLRLILSGARLELGAQRASERTWMVRAAMMTMMTRVSCGSGRDGGHGPACPNNAHCAKHSDQL